MKLGIKVDFDPGFARRRDQELDSFVEDVMQSYVEIAAERTPRRSGAAAKAWQTQGSGTQTTAENDRPYIQRLDEGYSKQAPRGITKPTIKEIRRKYR
jgi:hypothetical protein